MGRVAWRAANALVLLAASHLKKRGAEDPFLSLLMKHRPTGFLGELGVFGPLVRAAWATGKLGGLLLPTYKAAFRAATTPHGVVDASAGLLAIGSRFSKHRGEVRKTLTIAQRPGETHEEARRRLLGALMTLALDTAAAAPGTSRAVLCGTGRLRYQQQLSQALSKEEVEALVAELPDAVALPIATTIDISLFETDRRLRTAVAEFLAYTPQLELADLYFPQAWIDRVRRPSEAPAFERVFTAYRTAIMEIPPPARRPNTPGRNEPCPCASGRKYKRCCGA